MEPTINYMNGLENRVAGALRRVTTMGETITGLGLLLLLACGSTAAQITIAYQNQTAHFDPNILPALDDQVEASLIGLGAFARGAASGLITIDTSVAPQVSAGVVVYSIRARVDTAGTIAVSSDVPVPTSHAHSGRTAARQRRHPSDVLNARRQPGKVVHRIFANLLRLGPVCRTGVPRDLDKERNAETP